jgi:hypothetical protein
VTRSGSAGGVQTTLAAAEALDFGFDPSPDR